MEQPTSRSPAPDDGVPRNPTAQAARAGSRAGPGAIQHTRPSAPPRPGSPAATAEIPGRPGDREASARPSWQPILTSSLSTQRLRNRLKHPRQKTPYRVPPTDGAGRTIPDRTALTSTAHAARLLFRSESEPIAE